MSELRPLVYCIVPQDLAAKLHEPLRGHFAEQARASEQGPAVEVVVERRSGDRRVAAERRADPGADYGGRRLVRNPGGRRIADRRQAHITTEAPDLPRRARRYADQLVFLERLVPTSEEAEDIDTARLVTRIQAGESDGFAELYMRYFDRVYSYVNMVLRDSHAAEDLTQQAFLQILEAMPRYERRRTPFRAWLFIVVRNTMLKELRKRNRLDVVEPHSLESDQERAQAANGARDLSALRWITDTDLMLFIERLPVAQRQVLLLRFMLDLPASEIAKILGRSPADVRKTQERALSFLRQRLAAVTDSGRRGERGRSPWRRRPSFLAVLHARRFALHS